MNEIINYVHCSKCYEELPDGLSMKERQQLEVGFTDKGLQVWCKRHDCNVCHIDFEGQQHPANCESPKNTMPMLEEMDHEAFFNLRDWLEDALTAQGAKVIDKAMGFNSADIGITIEGMPFDIQVTPRPLYQGDYSDRSGGS